MNERTKSTMMVGRVTAAFLGAALFLLWLPTTAQQRRPASVATPSAVPDQLKNYVPITSEMLRQPRPEDWITFRNGYQRWGYSPLNQIDAGNVGQLRLVWSRAMQEGPQEVEPFVYRGVMFLPQTGDLVSALDATTGDLLWEYQRELPPDVGTITAARYRFRNIALYEEKVFLATQDAFLVALDAQTGEVIWETKRGDFREKLAATAGPVVIDGRLMTGSFCAPASTVKGGCFITANDVRTGDEIWRLNTIARPGEPGGDTWGDLPADERRHVSPWMPGSYDPDLGLTYWGTGVTQLGRDDLKGAADADLLYSNSTLALDPATGERLWYLQHLPRDYRDLDHVFERMIVETSVAPDPQEVPWISGRFTPGERRKVLTGIPGKTGIVWTLDAETGAFFWARPTVYQNIMLGWDEHGHRPRLNDPVAPPAGNDDPVVSCPSGSQGGKAQPSGAYSPITNAMYMPLNNACAALPAQQLRVPPTGRTIPRFASFYGRKTYVPGANPSTARIGRIEAISASTGRTVWTYEQRAPVYGSLLTTGGNLVFSGDVVRRFRAFHAETGQIVWETILNGPVSARPITYSVNGRQYVAIGAGGVTQGASLLALTPELNTTRGSNTLFVFALEP